MEWLRILIIFILSMIVSVGIFIGFTITFCWIGLMMSNSVVLLGISMVLGLICGACCGFYVGIKIINKLM